MDSIIYTVLIDENNSIKEIINHSNNNITSSNIQNIAKEILSKSNLQEKYIGILYLDNYSYSYIHGDSLTIVDNTIINNDVDGNFLRAKSDSWGNNGSNGGNVTLTMVNQKTNGNIVVDNVSTLNMTLTDSSYFEGAINTENSAKSIKLTLDSSSKIKLTSNCYLTEFSNSDTSNSNIDFNDYSIYVIGKVLN